MILSLKLALPLIALALSLQVRATESLKSVVPFLSQHCFGCHGAEKQKGDIRLDTLGKDLTKHENLEIWQGVLDQLNLGEMPPKKQPQPSLAEVKIIVETLSESLKLAYEKAISIDPDHSYAKDQLSGLKIDDIPQPVKVDTSAAAIPEQPKTLAKTKMVEERISTEVVEGKPSPGLVEKKISTRVIEKEVAGRTEKKANQKLSEIKYNNGYELQAGAFRSRKNADKIYKKFVVEAYPVRIVELTRPSGIKWHLVRIGRFDTKAEARTGQLKIKEQMGMDIIVRPYGRF